jgi:hypothetical protein
VADGKLKMPPKHLIEKIMVLENKEPSFRYSSTPIIFTFTSEKPNAIFFKIYDLLFRPSFIIMISEST